MCRKIYQTIFNICKYIEYIYNYVSSLSSPGTPSRQRWRWREVGTVCISRGDVIVELGPSFRPIGTTRLFSLRSVFQAKIETKRRKIIFGFVEQFLKVQILALFICGDSVKADVEMERGVVRLKYLLGNSNHVLDLTILTICRISSY